ncbi:MAG: response regulator [Nitrospirota bacterium]
MPYTILVLDDEESVRSYLETVLTGAGYTVLAAASGSIAVQLCAQFEGPIHLIIADVVLRSISGPNVVKYVLTMRPDTKALFISGHPREVLIEQGLSEEMPFLAKPFVFKELEGRIQELLRSSTPASGRLAQQEPAGSEHSKSLFARLHAGRSGGRTAGTDK